MEVASAERAIVSTLSAIDSESSFPKENREAAHKFVNFLRAKGSSPLTVAKEVYSFRKFLTSLPKGVSVSKAKKTDIEEALGNIESLGLAPKTKKSIKVTIKSFYKHFQGEDYTYPSIVAWVKTTSQNKKLLPEDILTEEEVLQMIKAAKNPRDKAIVALLYDAGIRIGELMTMKIKSVDLNSEPAHITVNGKTGMRQIPIMLSVPYIAQYLNFVNDRGPNDPLWLGLGTHSNKNTILDYDAVRIMLKRIGEIVGLTKRIYPHLFRHSRASNYANKLTEQQLKGFFGWSGDSRMVATYVHLSGRDIDKAVMEANGIKVSEKKEETKLKVRGCPKCKLANAVDSVYCSRCGSAMDVAIAVKQQQEQKALQIEIIQDEVRRFTGFRELTEEQRKQLYG